MKFVEWNFQDLRVPMVELDEVLYCTNKGICGALHIDEDTLRHIYSRHKDEFDSLSVTVCHAKEFFKQHKSAFGIF